MSESEEKSLHSAINREKKKNKIDVNKKYTLREI